MGRACSTNGGSKGTRIDYWWESQKERILGWILERWDGVMWPELVWLRIGTGGELL
jgi:hypothetical protein